MENIEGAVRDRYAAAASRIHDQGRCCETTSCCDRGGDPVSRGHYASEELVQVNLTEGASLGCGNPTLLAELHPGETVLDLGSGAGLDILLAARCVSPGGHAYGVDMTDEMLQLANQNQLKAGINNATFLKGTIEAIPLPADSVDVVISNCVINLAQDKRAVLVEAFRVLRPGGRLAVSDMVEVEELAPALKQSLDAWAGCVAGTIRVHDYRQALLDAGFVDTEFDITRTYSAGDVGLPDVAGKIGSASIRARKPAAKRDQVAVA